MRVPITEARRSPLITLIKKYLELCNNVTNIDTKFLGLNVWKPEIIFSDLIVLRFSGERKLMVNLRWRPY